MDMRQKLLFETEKHCKKVGISEATLATEVANDGKFFKRIRGGGGFTAATYEKFMEHFFTAPPNTT